MQTSVKQEMSGAGGAAGFLPANNEKPTSRKLNVTVDYRNSTMCVRIPSTGPTMMTQALIDELLFICRAIRGMESSPFRYRVLLSETPRVFCLGGDLALFRECILNRDRGRLARYAYAAVDAVWESMTGSGYADLCSVTLVQGEAQGGGFEAALAAHVLVAERGTCFGFPEGLFGLFPGMGAYQLLAARVAPAVARRIIGSAKRYTAEELFDLGVIDLLAPQGSGYQTVRDFINRRDTSFVDRARARYQSITKEELLQTVDEWVAQAMTLSAKHLRTIGYILQAQERHARQTNPVLAPKSMMSWQEALA